MQSDYPPLFSGAQLELLESEATAYALVNGISFLPPKSANLAPGHALHAPISLVPCALPKKLFQTIWDLQALYNQLYSRIAMDQGFLDEVFGGDLSEVDHFVGKLWRGWRCLRQTRARDQIHLGLFRSDYMWDSPTNEMKQVEFNTISSGFGPFGSRVSALHRHLAKTTAYFGLSATLSDSRSYPPNNGDQGLARGLAFAHTTYCEENLRDGEASAVILFVVQPNERNMFDQRWLEYVLLETVSRHKIKVRRQTLTELVTSAALSDNDRRLLLRSEYSPTRPEEISVVYYRAGYTPTDYLTESEWEVRWMLEQSQAINCPTLPLHLAGSKVVQQFLTKPGILERLLPPPSFPNEAWNALRRSWVQIWGLDDMLPDGTPVLDFILQEKRYEHLVIKPQREGGGNNVYRNAIPGFLQGLPKNERKGWIVMELIQVPADVEGYLARPMLPKPSAMRVRVTSEVGIYGWSLFTSSSAKGRSKIVKEETSGHVVRTKDRQCDEGGVSNGLGVVDSLILV